MINTRELYKLYVEEGGKLPYMKYREIVGLFHKKVAQKCISIGYEFQFPYHGGLLKIIQLERKYTVLENGNIRGSVDWGSSNKLKAEIIGRGETPLESYKDDKGKLTGNNGGVPWLVYYTTKTYFSWVFVANVYQKNWSQYKCKITDGNSESLSANINDNSYALFKLRQRNGNNRDFIKLRNNTKSTDTLQNT